MWRSYPIVKSDKSFVFDSFVLNYTLENEAPVLDADNYLVLPILPSVAIKSAFQLQYDPIEEVSEKAYDFNSKSQILFDLNENVLQESVSVFCELAFNQEVLLFTNLIETKTRKRKNKLVKLVDLDLGNIIVGVRRQRVRPADALAPLRDENFNFDDAVNSSETTVRSRNKRVKFSKRVFASFAPVDPPICLYNVQNSGEKFTWTTSFDLKRALHCNFCKKLHKIGIPGQWNLKYFCESFDEIDVKFECGFCGNR